MTKIEKRVCDNCKAEKNVKEFYLGIRGSDSFQIVLKYLAGVKYFPFDELDFCDVGCFRDFLAKLKM